MSSAFSSEIEALLSQSGNKICNDCGTQEAKWVSMDNAVFLCSPCARSHHQKLSKVVSKIKSLEVDSFAPQELVFLSTGGNTRFSDLMKEYNVSIPQSEGLEKKYLLKVSNWYRELLKREIQKDLNKQEYDEWVSAKPSKEEGLQYIDQSQLAKQVLKEDVSTILGKVEGVFSYVGGIVSEKTHQYGIDTTVKNAKDAISEKLKVVTENEKVKKVGEKTREIAEKTGEFINESAKKVYNSETAQKIIGKAEEGYANLKQKAQEMLGNNQEPPQEQNQETPSENKEEGNQ